MCPVSLPPAAAAAPPNSAEIPKLIELVGHRDCLSADAKVSEVYEHFKQHDVEFIGVVRGGRFLGAASRAQVGMLLGGRFGFAVFGRETIGQNLLADHLTVQVDTPLLEVLHLAQSRSGEAFHHDVALTEADGRYVGMIPLQSLTQVQSLLLRRQVETLEAQQRVLEERNEALFRSAYQLRQSEGRFGILFANSVLGVALSPEGLIELANERLDALLGPGAVGTNLFGVLEPEDRAGFAQLLSEHEDIRKPGESHTAEFLVTLAPRGPRRLKFFTHWIRETGQVCALIDDVTEQRALEERMKQRDKSALLDSLVGGIAHELNNKLLPVIGFSDLLLDKYASAPGAADTRETCEIIQRSASEAAGIVRQLLQLSRPPARELEQCDLGRMLQEAVPVLRFRARQDECSVSLDLPKELVCIRADPAQFKQLVVNLAFDAFDAMAGSASRQLTLRVTKSAGEASLWVIDTGHGIGQEARHRIFDPFFTTKAPNKGTGLGLSVCFAIVKQHGGEINLHRTGKSGTTFRISIPLCDQECGLVEPCCEPLSLHLPDERRPKARLQVLVADDEEYITRMVQEALRESPYIRVVQVATAETAIEHLASEKFDLIISDVRMPGIGGFGLLTWLRQHRPEALSRLLFITGDAGSAEMNQNLESSDISVLRKPFRIRELVERAQSLLEPCCLA